MECVASRAFGRGPLPPFCPNTCSRDRNCPSVDAQIHSLRSRSSVSFPFTHQSMSLFAELHLC